MELASLIPKAGKLQIAVPIAINMSEDAVGEPVSVPADIYYALTDDFTLGLTHSAGVVQPVSPYTPGNGICLTEDAGCPEIYDNVGLDSFYRFFSGDVQLAWHGGVDLRSIDDPTRLPVV